VTSNVHEDRIVVNFGPRSFVNIQCLPALVEGGLLSDVIPCIASVDSLMGGCDRWTGMSAHRVGGYL
jgi:NADH:ubiquinone oxidoreductase subunit D